MASPAKYRPEKVEPALYNLRDDVAETKNVAAANPDVVQRLETLAEEARADLGDTLTKRVGNGVRGPGRLVPAP